MFSEDVKRTTLVVLYLCRVPLLKQHANNPEQRPVVLSKVRSGCTSRVRKMET